MESAVLCDAFRELSEFVYEPSEDTFLLMDALEQDLQAIKGSRPLLCLEIGSGSGMIIASLAKVLGSTCFYFATDINPYAALSTKETSLKNKVNVETFISDLGDCVLSRLKGSVDLLLFNPPYVVTESEEVGGNAISASWAGGKNGREVIDRMVPSMVEQFLSPNGYFYLLLLKQNKPDEVKGILEAAGFKSEIIISRRCGAEQLCVLRSQRKSELSAS